MANVDSEVQRLYVAYFNRPADVDGLHYWSGVLAARPQAYHDIVDAFAASDEYRAQYAGLDNTGVVRVVYQHLFGRDAEMAGLNYWSGLLDRHAIGIGDVVTQVAQGAQGNDKTVIDAKVAVASVFTSHLDLRTEQLAYNSPVGIRIASNFLASITDAHNAAAALDPAAIDATIGKIVDPFSFAMSGERAELVGVPSLHL